jgi:hypothetical protein
LSQKVYIEKVLERFRMSNYDLSIEPIVKGKNSIKINAQKIYWKMSR